MNKMQAIVLGLAALAGCLYLLFFVEPTSLYIVVLFIMLATVLSYLLSSQFLTKLYQILIPVFVLIFLTMNYVAGFQIINTIFLVSIIIGVYILINSFRK